MTPDCLENLVEKESREYLLFADADPRRELMERVLINKSRIHATDTNAVLVAKAVALTKKTTLTDDDFDTIKQMTFAFSDTTFDKYAQLLVREIHETSADKIIIASYGSGVQGGIEKILQAKINSKLVASKKTVLFVGLDTYMPDSFSNSFFTKDTFHRLRQHDTRSFAEIVGLQDKEGLIVIANYVLHHQKARIQEFKSKCTGFPAIILEEPVDRKKWISPDYRFAVILYDLLANMAINPEWASIFLKKPEAFFVDYLFIDQLENLGEETIYFETTPLLSLTKV